MRGSEQELRSGSETEMTTDRADDHPANLPFDGTVFEVGTEPNPEYQQDILINRKGLIHLAEDLSSQLTVILNKMARLPDTKQDAKTLVTRLNGLLDEHDEIMRALKTLAPYIREKKKDQ
jgi:hypothetical protein